MRAVRIAAPGEIGLVEVPEPVAGPGEVVIDVAYAGVCGSDVEILTGGRPADYVRYPVTPGHEWAGTVSAVGAGVDGALIGRRVVAEGFHSCGHCASCVRGEPLLCESAYDETGFTRAGAWAERLVTDAALLHLLPDDADLRSAAGLEPAACAADAVFRARVGVDERVAVVGGGTIGLLAVQLLLAVPPSEVVLVEPNRRRAALAESWGADAITPDDTSSWTEHFDVVIEAAGVPGTAAASVTLARRGGRIVLAGIPDATASISVLDLVTKRLDIATVFGAPQRAWREVVAAYETGVVDPGALVTHELPLTDAAAALDLLAGDDPAVGKVLLRPFDERRPT